MFLKLKGGPHLLQSSLCVTLNGLTFAVKDMHPSFESLVVIDTRGLQVFLMDNHHDTSFRFILEDDSISLASRAHICSCLGKGARLWLIARPSIHLFLIAQSTFALTLHFHLGLIQLLTFNLFTCECGHGLDTSNMHLAHCPLGG